MAGKSRKAKLTDPTRESMRVRLEDDRRRRLTEWEARGQRLAEEAQHAPPAAEPRRAKTVDELYEELQREQREKFGRWFTEELAVDLDQHALLGLDRRAPFVEVRAAWLRLAKENHPDRGGDPTRFRMMQAAYRSIARRCPEPIHRTAPLALEGPDRDRLPHPRPGLRFEPAVPVLHCARFVEAAEGFMAADDRLNLASCKADNPLVGLHDARTPRPERRRSRMASVITLLNQKGGVGKSSTTFHLAGTLTHKMGRRVLLLDMDPQASLTQAFIGPDQMRALKAHESIAGLFGENPVAEPTRLIRPTTFDGLSLVAGSIHLTKFNVPEPERADRDDQRALRDFVSEVRDEFDYILIDVPPNLHLCSWAALAASDSVVVPLQAEDFGSQGISAVLDSIELVTARINPRLRMLGYLLTMHNTRLAVHKAYEETLRSLYGLDVFITAIPYAADMKEAVSLRLPIAIHKPRGTSAKAVQALAEEVADRSSSIMQETPRRAEVA